MIILFSVASVGVCVCMPLWVWVCVCVCLCVWCDKRKLCKTTKSTTSTPALDGLPIEALQMVVCRTVSLPFSLQLPPCP